MRFYSGCMASSRLPFIEAAATFVFKKIGLDIPRMNDVPCCMEPVGLRSMDRSVWRNTTEMIAEKADGTIVTVCDGCAISFATNGIDTKNFIETIMDNIDAVKENIVSPISLKLAVFPGCHCESVCGKKGIDAYVAMSEIVSIVGSKPFVPEKNLCCGGGVSGIDDVLAKKIMSESVDSFRSTGADAIVVSCPFCFMQFDMFARCRTYHIAELLAHSMGWNEDTEKFHRGKSL